MIDERNYSNLNFIRKALSIENKVCPEIVEWVPFFCFYWIFCGIENN